MDIKLLFKIAFIFNFIFIIISGAVIIFGTIIQMSHISYLCLLLCIIMFAFIFELYFGIKN